MHPDFKPLTFRFHWDAATQASAPSPVPQEIPPESKKAVRDLLRAGGYKPSGRGRPASESLLKALSDQRFPQIHPVVDFFNWLSTETFLPISVLDAGLIQGAWSFRLGEPEESYVFNPSGQELKLAGLLLLADEMGPTGSPVKDAQRTKISEATEDFLVVVWGTQALPEALSRAEQESTAWAKSQNLSFV